VAQLLGPDAGSRLVYVLSGGYIRSAAGRTVTMYTDAAATVLAAINTYDGTGVPAGLIAGSTVTVDSSSLLPRFWFPNGVDTLYAKVNPSGPVTAINADYDARLDAATGGVPSATVVAETSYGLSSSAGVAADFSRGDHTHGSPALPTPGAIGAQVADADLTDIAALTPADDDVIQRKAGAWTNRTMAQVKTDLVLTNADVGLSNVDNTSDANKPVSTATQTALNTKNTKLIVRRTRLTSGDIAVPNTGGTFALVAATTLAVPAVVGDYIEFNFDLMHNLGGSNYQDWCVVVAGSIVRAASSNTATPGVEGQVALYPGAAAFSTAPGPFAFVAVSGDLSGGNVTFQLAVKTAGVGTIFRSATYPMTLTARNYGAVDFA
jgi:hypothetical protein